MSEEWSGGDSSALSADCGELRPKMERCSECQMIRPVTKAEDFHQLDALGCLKEGTINESKLMCPRKGQ